MASENENEKRETLADLLAEMRREVGDGEDTYCGKRIIRRMDDVRVRQYCDRIEAAWKRDEERAVEHATRHAEAVARDNCRDCVHNPKGKNYEGGNAAAMREALEAALKFIGNLEIEPYSPLDEDTSELRQRIMDALSAPPRNCDVGTVEEQSARFVAWRYSNPLRAELGWDALEWAQKPYEQEGDEEHGKA